jgi:hypothetical protein
MAGPTGWEYNGDFYVLGTGNIYAAGNVYVGFPAVITLDSTTAGVTGVGQLSITPIATNVGLSVTGDAFSSDIVDFIASGGSSPSFSFQATLNSDAILTMLDGTGGDSATFFVGGNESNIALSDLAGDQMSVGVNAGTCLVTLQDSTSAHPNVTLQSSGGLPFVVLQTAAATFKSFIGQGTGLGGPTTFNLPPTDGTAGQFLQADGTGSTNWKGLSDSPSTQTVRDGPHAIVTATQGGPYTINFTTPFADNNYTVQVTLVCSEAVTVAVTSIVSVADVQLQAAGVGVIVTVANADSITHNVTIHVTAIHD